jgi:hypothetical protein
MSAQGDTQQLDLAMGALVRQIGTLFARGQAGGGRLEWREIETLLTDGYALALGLEWERSRRRADGLGYSVIERDIRWLRSLLDELHSQGRRFRVPLQARP